MLRTYKHRYSNAPNWIRLYNEGSAGILIWQVARATSATPFFFANAVGNANGETINMSDGGIRENNPSGAAFSEFVSIYGEDQDPGLLLSIGAGRPETDDERHTLDVWPGPLGSLDFTRRTAMRLAVFKNLLIKTIEGEKQHRALFSVARGESTWYKRFNVEMTHPMKLDEWVSGSWRDPYKLVSEKSSRVPGGATLTKMEEYTNVYMRKHGKERHFQIATKLRLTAEKLVHEQRARQRTSLGGQ